MASTAGVGLGVGVTAGVGVAAGGRVTSGCNCAPVCTTHPLKTKHSPASRSALQICLRINVSFRIFPNEALFEIIQLVRTIHLVGLGIQHPLILLPEGIH